MKVIDLKCDSCGAIMQLSEDKRMAKCPYCKNKMLIQKTEDIHTLKKHAEELGYVKEAGKQRAIDEAKRKRKIDKIKKIFKLILIIAGIIGVSIFFPQLSKDKIDDPFKCVDIKFSGINGDGKIRFIDNSKCSEYNDINFIASKEKDLKEGETIKIDAQSNLYRFGVSSKEFKVEGLSIYLNDLNNLSDDLIKKIHEFSHDTIEHGSFGITFRGEIASLEPYKLYLYTNGIDSNILYDVYKTSVKTPSGKTFDKFVVAYYKDFLLIKNKTDFSYSKVHYCGNSIKAGDPTSYSGKDYVGYITGFLTEAEFKAYLNAENDGSYDISER